MTKNRRMTGAAALAMAAFAFLSPPAHAAKRFKIQNYDKRPAEWFASEEARRIADNLESYQTPEGGWPKNIDMAANPADPETHYDATIDNWATYPQIRYLSMIYNATREPRDLAAINRGLDYLLDAQYPNGGWPQYYPPKAAYSKYITYNDNAMTGVMELLRDMVEDDAFAFVDEARRVRCVKALAAGLKCILKTQIVVDGKPTVWCQQHDETTLAPVGARSFELASFSGQESAGVTLYLMAIENPPPEVRAAVEGAVAWFEENKIEGIRIERSADDCIVVEDPEAGPLWARYYDLETGRPFFCGRDGVKKATMAEVEQERRFGYSWHSSQPAKVLKKYPGWKAKNP